MWPAFFKREYITKIYREEARRENQKGDPVGGRTSEMGSCGAKALKGETPVKKSRKKGDEREVRALSPGSRVRKGGNRWE